jgi:hypothetical protein
VVGRVRIITSLWQTGDDRTLPLLPYRMDKVEPRETVWKIGKAPSWGFREWAKGMEKPHFAVLCHRRYAIRQRKVQNWIV